MCPYNDVNLPILKIIIFLKVSESLKEDLLGQYGSLDKRHFQTTDYTIFTTSFHLGMLN